MPLQMEDVLNGTESWQTRHDVMCAEQYSKHMQRFERRWKQWAEEWTPDLVTSESSMTRIPTPCEIQAFLLHLGRTIKGQLTTRCTITTLETYWAHLERFVRHRFGHRYPGDERNATRQFIRHAMTVHEGLTTKGREKSMASKRTVIDVLHFLWACDTEDLGHSRTRLQLSLGILMLIFLGIRPGEIVESSNYKRSNEGILYKDLKFVAFHEASGNLGYACLIKIRNRKWARGNEKKAYTMILRNDTDSASLCPLQQLLALAIADHALEKVHRLEDLAGYYTPPPGQPFMTVPVRQEMSDVPLLRHICDREGVHATKIWSYHRFHGLLKDIGQRAGYSDPLLPYNFRRGHGNILMKFVSAVQRRKQMGHKSDDTFLAYLSNTSGINVQDIVHGKQPDNTLMEALGSMDVSYRHVDAPLQHVNEDDAVWDPASFEDGVVRPEPSAKVRRILECDTLRSRLVESFYNSEAPPDLHVTVPILVAMALQPATPRQPATWRSPTGASGAQDDEDPCKNFFYPEVRPIDGKTCTYCGVNIFLSGNKQRQWDHLLDCHLRCARRDAEDEQRLRILRNSPICRWSICRERLECLSLAAIRTHMGRHFSGKNKKCLWRDHGKHSPCFEEPSDYWSHFSESHDVAARETDAESLMFCYECRVYSGGEQWKEHCNWHLSRLRSVNCEQIKQRGCIIQPRLCPFCLGDEKLSPHRRMKPLNENAANRSYHLANDVKKLSKQASWPLECPHPLCPAMLPSESEALNHCYAVHLPTCRLARPKTQKKSKRSKRTADVAPSLDRDIPPSGNANQELDLMCPIASESEDTTESLGGQTRGAPDLIISPELSGARGPQLGHFADTDQLMSLHDLTMFRECDSGHSSEPEARERGSCNPNNDDVHGTLCSAGATVAKTGGKRVREGDGNVRDSCMSTSSDPHPWECTDRNTSLLEVSQADPSITREIFADIDFSDWTELYLGPVAGEKSRFNSSREQGTCPQADWDAEW